MKKPSRSGTSEYTEKRSRFLGTVLHLNLITELHIALAIVKRFTPHDTA